jgi:putative hydrolase of the HAD superfamily
MLSHSAENESIWPLPHADIKAVTFDVGGTLIECWPSVGHIYAEIAGRHAGKAFSPEVLNRRFSAAWRGHPGFRHTRSDWAALVEATFAGLLGPLRSEDFFAELYDRFSEPAAWHVFPDVRPALEALGRRSLRLGIISNWDERLRPLLDRLELSRYFETIVVSCETGAPKPARPIFEQAMARLGCPPQALLHVGDSLDQDVRGAQAAGCQALWLRRGAGSRARGQIESLDELGRGAAAARGRPDHG